MNQRLEIEGFFIPFTIEEAGEIRKILQDNDYTPDGKGLKELIFDIVDEGPPEESDTERFVRKAHSYIREHPETVRMGMSALRGFAEMIGKSRR